MEVVRTRHQGYPVPWDLHPINRVRTCGDGLVPRQYYGKLPVNGTCIGTAYRLSEFMLILPHGAL